jgi:hypothetical protein
MLPLCRQHNHHEISSAKNNNKQGTQQRPIKNARNVHEHYRLTWLSECIISTLSHPTSHNNLHISSNSLLNPSSSEKRPPLQYQPHLHCPSHCLKGCMYSRLKTSVPCPAWWIVPSNLASMVNTTLTNLLALRIELNLPRTNCQVGKLTVKQ